MSVSVSGANLAQLPRKSGSRSKRDISPFRPECLIIESRAADLPFALRITNSLRDVPTDIVDDAALLKVPSDPDEARRRLILTVHRGKALKKCPSSCADNFCCGSMSLDLVSASPIECSYDLPHAAREATPAAFVDLEAILREVSSFLARNEQRYFRIRSGETGDPLAQDHLFDFARVLIPFFASKRNAIYELKTRTSFVDHLLDLKHRNRTVISWALNAQSIIESEERGVASLDERLAAAAKVAAAGFGVGFCLDPVIVNGSPEEATERYGEVVDKMLTAVPSRSIAWVRMGLLKFDPDLPARALKRFPGTRIFAGEIVPVGKLMRYPRFIRERVLKVLWEKLNKALPPHKLHICGESAGVWGTIDPSICDSSCLEKRLCNLETLPISF